MPDKGSTESAEQASAAAPSLVTATSPAPESVEPVTAPPVPPPPPAAPPPAAPPQGAALPVPAQPMPVPAPPQPSAPAQPAPWTGRAKVPKPPPPARYVVYPAYPPPPTAQTLVAPPLAGRLPGPYVVIVRRRGRIRRFFGALFALTLILAVPVVSAYVSYKLASGENPFEWPPSMDLSRVF